MKKVTKFLIGAGIGYLVGKFIKDHLKIEINIDVKEPDKPIEDEKTKELYDEALEQFVSHEDEDEEANNICLDHVYYDNKYNICSILLDDDGCPYAFEFAYADDVQKAYNEFKNLYAERNVGIVRLSDIFHVLGLIIDDYEEFKKCFVFWDDKKFEDAHVPGWRFFSFGEMQK